MNSRLQLCGKLCPRLLLTPFVIGSFVRRAVGKSSWISHHLLISRSQHSHQSSLVIKQSIFQIFVDSCSSFVEMKYKKDFAQSGARFCKTAGLGELRSESEMVVVMHNTLRASGSFSLKYRSEGGAQRPTTESPVTRAGTTRTATTITRRSSTAAVTTKRPVTNTRPSVEGWSEWSACSKSCGGCGERTRSITATFGVVRQGSDCGFEPCPTTKQQCSISLNIPCSLLSRFRSQRFFDPKSQRTQAVLRDLPKDFGKKRLEMVPEPMSDAGAQNQSGICKRKFLYPCGDDSDEEEGECCDGFSSNGVQCTRR